MVTGMTNRKYGLRLRGDDEWVMENLLVNSYFNIGYNVFGLAEVGDFEVRMFKFITKV